MPFVVNVGRPDCLDALVLEYVKPAMIARIARTTTVDLRMVVRPHALGQVYENKGGAPYLYASAMAMSTARIASSETVRKRQYSSAFQN